MRLKNNKAINLNVSEVNKRRVLGIVFLIADFFFAFFLLQSAFFYRFFLVIPFFATILCFYQAKEKVCVVYALKKTHKVSDECSFERKVESPSLAAELSAKGRGIIKNSLIVASLITIIFLFL
eukprot:TRINITY_DN22554_c0_g1_i1.p1 TRINITY_DN22554_c0_g1~~TRINITY_DN22554_c0_g1_i1.p1  ORF type:complete len:131 (-),score=10.92 TRINITY_DN22554_c0_g1_i1:126-494(-)